jgi:hypothetical protein
MKRCNQPATWYSAVNGYRVCDTHKAADPDPSVFLTLKPSSASDAFVSRCDYPMEQLAWPAVTLRVARREFDTILAALRFYQEGLANGEVARAIAAISSEHGKPLTIEEIDTLCERINCS